MPDQNTRKPVSESLFSSTLELREVASGHVFRVGGSLAARVWDFNETYVNET